MAGFTKKRTLDDAQSAQQQKKTKATPSTLPAPIASTAPEDVDFPRGGGTTFTPLEVKAIRAEAIKEADDELFKDSQAQSKKRKRKSTVESSKTSKNQPDRVRIEHLNYKRMHIGMKILGQIIAIQPLALIVSLPNQLFGHVPVTNISSQLTQLLEREEEDDESTDEESNIPELSDLFTVGQYVRAAVATIHVSGSTDLTGFARSRDETTRASRRVELTLVPDRVNAGVQKADIKPNLTLTAAIKSVEDHGYVLDIGIPDIAGFLPFKTKKSAPPQQKYVLGQLADVTVLSLSANGRTCSVTSDTSTFIHSCSTEVSNVTSVLPGAMVQCLITASQPAGLNLQVLGFFEGTVEQLHLDPEKTYAIGKKVKARILYDILATPPRFVLALVDHIAELSQRKVVPESSSAPQSPLTTYPIGTILESVKVLRVETERGLLVEVTPAIQGFVHISHLSDDHLPTIIASSPWKVNSLHRARVTGYFAFDGILQLSLKPSILEEKFFQVQDVEVGEIVKGTVKKLTDSGLFVSISGSFDGVVWPNHYADIALKHPAKRFKVGGKVKCRVLVVDPESKKIALTAKKSLVESTLPCLTRLEDAKVGMVTHAVVFKVLDKSLMIEFYNNIKAVIPFKEASEVPLQSLATAFAVGKVVKVRLMTVDQENRRIVASIRQMSTSPDIFNLDISGVEIGNVVKGVVREIHKDNAILALQPSKVRALISLNNLANRRGIPLAQLRTVQQVGEELEDLLVVTRNVEDNFVIVAHKPRSKESLKGALDMESVTIGQVVQGRVTKQTRHGALVKMGAHVGGFFHPTDASDDYASGSPFPVTDTILKAAVVGIDLLKKQLTLSTRHSRMYPNQPHTIVDREIQEIQDLAVGDTVRGFVKTVADHGLFITIGRGIDARVQIRELFDDYVKEWQGRFQVKQVVKGRILSLDLESKRVEMTLRSGELKRGPAVLGASDLSNGQKVEGIIKKIEPYGLFISIQGSKLSGLCHKSELSDNADADLDIAMQGFREGDKVKAVILKIEQRRISLSLKPSLFDPEDFATDDEANDVQKSHPEPEQAQDDEVEQSDDEDDQDDGMKIDLDIQPYQLPAGSSAPPKSTVPSLVVSGGFQWSAPDVGLSAGDEEDEPESEDEEAGAPSRKKRKRKQIEHDLTADMHTKTPESNSDFERLLLGSPNSSYLWIQYMSFQLQISEVEKAREVAHRGLKTIHFREEQERLNVWIALLNLECTYGTDESLEKCFKDAAKANDSKTVHLRLAAILDQADKHDKAEEQFRRTCKKFGPSSKVWTLFSEHYLRQGKVEESRKLLPRSLQSLDKRKHLKTISRFAQLEYKLGEPERGKTLFEGILDSHSKRWDIWSIYIDMEAGQEDIQSLRNVFDRIFTIKMTSHKAKAFFKKWLELERRIGDEAGEGNVKAKAVEWTQRANAV